MTIPLLSKCRVVRHARHVACLLALILAPDVAGGQARNVSRLSLEQAIEAARSVSPDLIAARHAVAAAEARTRQAGAWPNPVVSYGREQTSADGATSSQDVIAVEQRLEMGALRSSRIAAARARHDAAVARMEAVRSQVAFEVTRAYATAVAARGRLQLAEEAANAFARAVRVSDRRLVAGDVAGFAHRRIQLESARYGVIRAEAQLAHRTAEIGLATLVSGTPDAIFLAEFEFLDSLPTAAFVSGPEAGPAAAIFALSADSLVGHAMRSRSDLRALELEVVAARAEARVASATRLPIPAFGLGFKSERSPDLTGSASGFIAGVSVPLALFDRGQGAMRSASAESERALVNAEGFRRRVAREVAEALVAWRSIEEPLAALAPHLGESALRAMRAVQVAYDEGEMTLLEWLDAVRAYQEAESSFIVLRAEVMIRRAALIRAVGDTQTGDRGPDTRGRN
jgi:cobalt-zinc-cadmium efflux system outer membrane protein